MAAHRPQHAIGRAHREFLDVDVAPTAPMSPPTRTQELRPPPGWG